MDEKSLNKNKCQKNKNLFFLCVAPDVDCSERAQCGRGYPGGIGIAKGVPA
jgi:hypothetical protein